MLEVLTEDIGYEEPGSHVRKPLEELKIASESFEHPKYLGRMIETVGAQACDNCADMIVTPCPCAR